MTQVFEISNQLTCLNRTSVGLKRLKSATPADSDLEPQSNQRGIETTDPDQETSIYKTASIEPAWD